MFRQFSLLFWSLLIVAAFRGAYGSAASPNIVVIYADDLGYGDVACYNPERGKIATPHIDRLASEGLRFTDAHSSSGVCSPSRYTLLTGRYHWRTRLQKGIVGLWQPPLISASRPTIATLASTSGYATACIGKWHLGWNWPIANEERSLFRGDKKQETQATLQHQAAWQATFRQPIPGGPISRGFERYFGTDVPNWPPYCFIDQDKTVGIPSEFLPLDRLRRNQASIQGPAVPDWRLEPILPTLADQACKWIEEQVDTDKPFLLYLPLTSPHTPLAVNSEWLGKSGLNLYADLVMETDAAVGRVLEAIDRQKIAEETLIIFTSDNGCAPYIGASDLESQGHFPSGPLRGYKSDVWEGGHRVPFIVRWPGVVAAETTCDALVHQADVYETLREILAVPSRVDAGEDSFSILPLLRGELDSIREHAVSQSSQGLLSIRQNEWKLIFGPGSGGWTKGRDELPVQLYNLQNDLGETRNMASELPDRVGRMQDLMEQLIRNGRSTDGPIQRNDVPLNRKQCLPGLAADNTSG